MYIKLNGYVLFYLVFSDLIFAGKLHRKNSAKGADFSIYHTLAVREYIGNHRSTLTVIGNIESSLVLQCYLRRKIGLYAQKSNIKN
jgi:hypothetical protein